MLQSRVRNRLFLTILVPLVAFLVPFEWYGWGDSALLLYGLTLLFTNACIGFWFYWLAVNKKRASSMFILIGVLFVCVDYSMAWQFYARWNWVYFKEVYSTALSTNLWAYRVLPEMILFIWLLCWIVGRSFGAHDLLMESPSMNMDEKYLFFKAQGLFHNEQEIFIEAQNVFSEAQGALSRAQTIFARAQAVFEKAQELFNKPEER